jgi:hypothetical protein
MDRSCLERKHSRLRASRADQRLPVGFREDIVEIEMELPEQADPGAAVAIDGNYGLKADW